jgi:hypothetical protein
MQCNVLCRHGGYDELQECWFPTTQIVDNASYYGIENKLPILVLPERAGDYSTLEWPSLMELNVRSAVGLSFYMQALSLLSAENKSPQVGVKKLSSLYKHLGDRVTLQDQRDLVVCCDAVLT